MHYIIIIIVIIVIISLQIKIYRNTNKRLNVFQTIFPEEIDGRYTIGQDGIILDRCSILEKEIGKLEKTRKQKKNEKEELERELSIQSDCRNNLLLEEKKLMDGLYVTATDRDLENKVAEISHVEQSIELIKKSISDKQSKIKNIEQKISEYNTQKAKLPKRDINPIWDKIIESINRYLERNKGAVSDFHLIKDIADRNIDSEEEAIQTQIPYPLYYGLMGTMAGIIIGVGYFYVSGALNALFNPKDNAQAVEGVGALLGGIAIAMFCSIIGIILTTRGSSSLKNIKNDTNKRKHDFLSWLQTELLPKLNNDMVGVLDRMTANLTSFNDSFADNADKLQSTLVEINKATEGQSQLLLTIENLKINRIATANIAVYDKLKDCTSEIGNIALQLENSRKYLDSVRELNEKLDASENRTRAIEDMAVFFQKERANIDAMSVRLREATASMESALHDTIEHMKEESTKQVAELVAHATEQRQHLQSAIDSQDNVLKQKTEEMNKLISNLGSVEKMISTLEASARKQNQSISALSQQILALAQQKASGDVTIKREKLPLWARIMIIAGGSVVSMYCLIELVKMAV